MMMVVTRIDCLHAQLPSSCLRWRSWCALPVTFTISTSSRSISFSDMMKVD